MTRDEEIRRIERDRRRREDELLLILLLISGRSLYHALIVQQHGGDVLAVIRNVIQGNSTLGFRGVAPAIAATMADAHRDAIRRLGRMTGDVIELPPMDELIALYRDSGRAAAASMVDTLTRAVSVAIFKAETAGESVRKAIREAFRTSGYTRDNPYALDVGAERAVVGAYNAGMITSAEFHGVAVGLRHVSVIDDRTTDICRERDGLQLPADHPYWLTNCPPLHNHCRSIIFPMTREFDESDVLPSEPPAPGFGAMPTGFFQSLGF